MLVFDFFKESKIETFTKPLDAWLRQPQALAAGTGEKALGKENFSLRVR